jgi:rhodanese-related sulfurtransferase
LYALSVSADKTPTNLSGAKIVDAEAVIALVNKYPKMIIIDSRIPGDRLQGYIEGSVSLPDVKTDCASLAHTIPSKEYRTLFYCNGINCGRSANAIKIALSCGYDKIYWFRGGFIEWKLKGYPFLQK